MGDWLAIETSELPRIFTSLPYDVINVVFYKVSTFKFIKFFQNSTSPLPLWSRGTMNIWSNYKFCFIFFSLASFAHVLAMNMTKGSFARVKSTSSFSITKFPSPRQFHTRRLMILGGAIPHPLVVVSWSLGRTCKHLLGKSDWFVIPIMISSFCPNRFWSLPH